MTVVVDQPSTLADASARKELLHDERLTEVLILKDDFDDLPESEKVWIGEMIKAGKFGFVQLHQIKLDDVGTLKLMYDGISIEGLMLLTFCQTQGHSLQSNDPALLKAARELNIEMFEFFNDKLKKVFNENIALNR